LRGGFREGREGGGGGQGGGGFQEGTAFHGSLTKTAFGVQRSEKQRAAARIGNQCIR
jgi:hypothetical protein